MSQIDWSKAPEGATHFTPAKREHHRPVFWKVVDGVARKAWCMSDDCSRVDEIFTYGPDGCIGFNMDDAVSIHATPAPWDGTGLPPVGTVCDYNSRDSLGYAYDAPKRVTVFGTDGDYAAIRGDGFRCWVPVAHLLPLRTPEQLAAEEREKAICEMASIIGAPLCQLTATQIIEKLYDAGLRFPEGGAA